MYDFLLVGHCKYSSIELDIKVTTLISELEVTQGHWNWCHSKAWLRFPTRLL